MKRLLLLFGLIFCAGTAHAATCPVSSGASWATIKSTITGCGSGNIVTLAAGTYTGVNSTVTIPCGVSITGPVIAYSQTHYQTAILQESGSITQPFETSTGCSGSPSSPSSWQHFSYLEWNGEQSTGGGGFIYMAPGTQYVMVDHDYIHGAGGNLGSYPGCCSEVQVMLDGTNTSALTSYITVTMNEFGPETAGQDCGTAMTATETEEGGGFCNGWASQGQTNYVSVTNNIFHNLEQGAKVTESCSGCGSSPSHGNTQNFTMAYNWFYNIQRIPFETQSNYYDTSHPTLQYIQYNVLGNRNGNATTGIGTGQQNFDFSIANGCGNPPATSNCVSHVDYNVDVQNLSNTSVGAGLEHWGSSGTTGNYNLLEGYVAIAGGGFVWAQDGAFTYNDNTFNITSGAGKSTNCAAPNGGYWNSESGPASTPSCTGNTFASTGTGTYASAAPTIPSSQSFTGSFTVNVVNSGTNRDLNTTDWCTTDGSTPSPGSGTAVPYYQGGSFSVTTTTTVKCIGMWGALNQPYSYPSNYGYVPSGGGTPVTAIYTSGGTSPAAQPTFSPAAGSYTGVQNVAISTTSTGAVICWSTTVTNPVPNGSGGCTTGTLYTGTISVSSNETLYAVAGAGTTTYTNSTTGSAAYSFSTPAATPTFSPATENFYPTVSVSITSATSGSTIYYCTTTTSCTPTTSSTVYTGPIAVSSTTIINAIATASGYVTSATGTGTYTYTLPALTSCSIGATGGVTSIAIGGTAQGVGTCSYSSIPTSDTCSPGADSYLSQMLTADWASSNTSIFTVNSSGLITGVSAGSANVQGKASQNGGAALTCSSYSITVTAPPTLNSATMVIYTGGSSVQAGSQVTMCVNLAYVSPTENTQICGSGTDIYGTAVSGYTSSSTANATIVSATGVLTGVAVGSTTVQASAGSFNPSLVVTVTAAPTNPTFQVNGPVNFGGNVRIQ
jgi:hypothetical protein